MLKLNLLVAAVLGLSSLSEAAGNIKFGDVAVKPRATLEEKYDDNIFLQPTNKRDSQIVMLNLGTGFHMGGSRSKLFLSYDLGLLHYDRFSGVSDAVHHTAGVGAGYELANGGNIGVDNNFKATTDPASSELTARAKRNQNDAKAWVEFPVGGKMFLGLTAVDTVHDYRKQPLSDTLDRNELSVGPRFGYKLSEKVRTFVDYRFGDIKYDVKTSSKDNTTHMLSVGAEGDFTARLTGGVQVGVLSRDYDKDVAGQKNKESTPSVMAKLKWAAPRDYTVSFTASRAFQESTFNRYYKTSTFGVAVGKPLGNRWNAGLNVGYGVDQYPDAQPLGTGTAKRDDKLTQAGLNVAYQFPEIFKLNVGYNYRNRSSNFDTFDYKNNVLTLGLGMEF